MAKIGSNVLTDFKNGETVHESDLDTPFEIIRTTINENADMYENHKTASVIDHPDKSVTAAKLADNAVTARAIAPGTITADKVASGALDGQYYNKAQLDAPNRDHKGTWRGMTPEMIGDALLSQRIYKIEQKLDNTDSTTKVLNPGMNVVTTDISSPVNVLSIRGRTLRNLLGSDGNCESTSPFTYNAGGSPTFFTLDSISKVYGDNSIKYQAATVSFQAMPIDTLEAGKYYIALADVKSSDGVVQGSVAVLKGDATYHQSPGVASTTFQSTYKAFLSNGTESHVGMYVNPNGGSGYVNFDGIRLYEIDKTTYDKIDVDSEYTGAKLVEKFPHVDGVKHVVNPSIHRVGKNMIPPYTMGWLLTPEAQVEDHHKLAVVSDGTSVISVDSPAIPTIVGQSYTLSASGLQANSMIYILNKAKGSTPIATLNAGAQSVTFTAIEDTVYVRLRIASGSPGTYIFNKAQLELGTSATVFEPYNDDRLTFLAEFASNASGSAYETVQLRDGQYMKYSPIGRAELDGGLPWIFSSDFDGYKKVSVADYFDAVPSSELVTKSDGTLLKRDPSFAAVDTSDLEIGQNTLCTLSLAVADDETGWDEAYTPTSDEVKAFFNGWKRFAPGVFHPINAVRTDFDLPKTVVQSGAAWKLNYSGVSQRKFYELSNGWWVIAVTQATATNWVVWRVSKDKGETWENLCSANCPTNIASAVIAMAVKGTMVYTLLQSYGYIGVYWCAFDAATVTNGVVSLAQLHGMAVGDNHLTLCYDAETDSLYAGWTIKPASYSYSVYYAQGVLDDNDLPLWSMPERLYTRDTTNQHMNAPYILVYHGIPIILIAMSGVYFDNNSVAGGHAITLLARDHTFGNYNPYLHADWTYIHVYTVPSASYLQRKPFGVVLDDDIHVIWDGLDAVDTSQYNIRYTRMVGGRIPTDYVKLTSGNTYGNQVAAIGVDATKRLHIYFDGKDPVISASYLNIRRIIREADGTFGSVTTLTNNTTSNAQNVLVLVPQASVVTTSDFPYAYDDTQAAAVQVAGNWSVIEGVHAGIPTGRAPGTTPYKMMYELKHYIEEPIPVEGALAIASGGNLFDVKSGLIVRERVKNFYREADSYVFNKDGYPDTYCDHKVKKFVAVYKNGMHDPGWVLDASGGYGDVLAYIAEDKFDPTAIYHVTYEPIEDTPVIAYPVEISYKNTIKSVVDATVLKVADIEDQVSINANAIIDILVRMKAGGL